MATTAGSTAGNESRVSANGNWAMPPKDAGRSAGGGRKPVRAVAAPWSLSAGTSPSKSSQPSSRQRRRSPSDSIPTSPSLSS